ncbi:MAG TPA: carbamoyltransferase HypF [Solirubrobacteraceae bacterium]|jgi:hydrogenase maturation protein HypF|nr:carbamoyltransferase HypF [Solirubrobacteraceae bacterium]
MSASTRAPVADAERTRRINVRVAGTVQGVGFRPFVHRLAGELGLGGYVLNDNEGVLAEVEGSAADVERFIARLREDAPPLARVERIETQRRAATGERSFAIRPSARDGTAATPITPDSATCGDCLRELFDPGDRRYRYPFINCTNCGPRFTIVRGVPYDRPLTTMAGFRMCAPCRAEYEDPADRRFHAQPNACADCGPALSLLAPDGTRVAHALAGAVAALQAGRIVAVKGIGGYHLACRADDEAAVGALRARKHREDKPFAVMVRDLPAALQIVELDAASEAALSGPERPIVLAARHGEEVARSVAPGAPELGVMLPYSPLHHLLLAGMDGVALVMTSGNVSDEPIAFRDGDALRRLDEIADLLLVHDRPIETRTDDSVVRVVASRRTMLRRSRGYVPASLTLPGGCERPILACGAELKSTFCLARGSRAWVSHHIGDLENYETLRSFTDGIEHFQRLFDVAPQIIAHDLHPEYLSTKYAMDSDAEQLIGVQHHHAHMAACLAEHDEQGPALGAIFDGSGYGTDGSIWGGELLLGDTCGFVRIGSLRPVPMPGGARAISEPWRMACAWLAAVDDREGAREMPPSIPPTLLDEVDESRWSQVARLAREGSRSPLTTSAGRLFDALAALAGVRARVNYEGQAAIELEAACAPDERRRYPIAVARGHDRSGPIEIDPRETVDAALRDLLDGAAAPTIAARFHNAFAAGTVEALRLAAEIHDVGTAVLAGGVFQNRRLLHAVLRGARESGLLVLIPEALPLGDGAISYGQAVVASRVAGDEPSLADAGRQS